MNPLSSLHETSDTRAPRARRQACSPLFGIVVALLLHPLSGSATPALDSIDQRVKPCVVCHGDQGRATAEGFFPRIAGKPAGYLYHQLLNFRDGNRSHAVMTYLLERQSDAYLREMADHFAGLHPPYPPPPASTVSATQRARGEQLVRHGDAARQLPACDSCHGARLTGVLPATPGLIGLPLDYLGAQLGAWQAGSRRATTPDCMATIARRLSLDDLVAVTAWLAAQPVPADARPQAAPSTPLPMECGDRAMHGDGDLR